MAISADFADLSPNMDISEITIELDQRYGSDSIKVLNEGGKYKAVYEVESKMLPDDKKYKRYLRELSSAESVWLEKQLATTINNPDNSTWQSLPGGDIMDVVIKQSRANDVCLRGIKPIKKYMHLQSNLEKLAEYGSFQVHSVK